MKNWNLQQYHPAFFTLLNLPYLIRARWRVARYLNIVKQRGDWEKIGKRCALNEFSISPCRQLHAMQVERDRYTRSRIPRIVRETREPRCGPTVEGLNAVEQKGCSVYYVCARQSAGRVRWKLDGDEASLNSSQCQMHLWNEVFCLEREYQEKEREREIDMYVWRNVDIYSLSTMTFPGFVCGLAGCNGLWAERWCNSLGLGFENRKVVSGFELLIGFVESFPPFSYDGRVANNESNWTAECLMVLCDKNIWNIPCGGKICIYECQRTFIRTGQSIFLEILLLSSKVLPRSVISTSHCIRICLLHFISTLL